MINFSIYHRTFFRAQLFHTTGICRQRPDHHLYAQVDWNQVKGGNYAVVDPMDPSNILYLSPRSYIAAQKTWISNDVAVVVLATPKDSPNTDQPTSSKSNLKGSPKRSQHSFLNDGLGTGRDAKGRIWGAFQSPMIKFINHYVSSKSARVNSEISENIPQPAVEINNGNIVDLTLEWGHLLHFKLFGLASGRGFRSSLNEFAEHVALIFRTQGGLLLTKRLKIYALCVKSYLGKNPYSSTKDLGIRIRLCGGLPKALPSQVRSVLRSRPVQSIRLWISILHYYKAMVVKSPKPDLSGVVSTPVDLPEWIVHDFALFQIKFLTLFKDVLARKPKPDYSEPEFYSTFKSGPNMRPALAGLLPDLFGWMRSVASKTGWISTTLTERPITPNTTVRDLVKICLDLIAYVESLLAKSLAGDIEATKLLSLVPVFRFASVWGITKWLYKAMMKMIPEMTRQIGEQTGYNKSAGLDDYMSLYLEMEREAKGLPNPKTVKGQSKARKQEGVYDWHDKLFAGLPMDNKLPDFYYQPPVREPWISQGPATWSWLSEDSDEMVTPKLTKLSFLQEPAGKVRVIAIVDWWSQQALKPIHEWMFDLLASLPTDATFSQEGSLRTFAKEVGKSVYSFDLKSATEMIPQELYRIVFSAFWTGERASVWMDLLVDRWFHYYYKDEKSPENNMSGVTRYRRGQPMGALSSWASMALVHHSLVQYAASKVQKYPFWGYRILGDDIVIGDESVAKSYLEVCKLLQVPISLPKSLQSSNGFFDFASQILQYMRNFSPISLREEFSAYNPVKRVEMALRSVRRGLVDFSKPGWFSAYLKLVVSPTVYKQIVEARQLGKLDIAAKVVLIQTLGTLEILPLRFGLQSMPRVTIVDSIKALLPTMSVFRTDFKTSLSLGSDRINEAARDIACEAICFRADVVYKKYLKLKPLMDSWKKCDTSAKLSTLIFTQLSPDNKYLAKLLTCFPTMKNKLACYSEWEEKYRRPLKTIQVCWKLKGVPADLLEHTCEATLDELWNTVVSAEADLLVSPDMVLGVAPSVEPKNILKPTAKETAIAGKFFTRLGVWSELVSVISLEESLILGIPGLRAQARVNDSISDS